MHHYLEATAEDLRDEGFQVHAEVIEGEPAAAIVSRAEGNHMVEAIVMATHGGGDTDLRFPGSITEEVERYCPVNLLLVHPGERIGSLRRFYERTYHSVIVALDGSTSDDHALESARTLGGAEAKLLLLCAVPGRDVVQLAGEPVELVNILRSGDADAECAAEGERMRQYLSEAAKPFVAAGLSVETRVMHGDPAEEILRYASQANADLIVMPTEGPTQAIPGFDHLSDNSVATTLMRKTSLPVLLARAALDPATQAGRQVESSREPAAVRSEEVFVA
jgi:nucleotide-binding universal stress UspA family protein